MDELEGDILTGYFIFFVGTFRSDAMLWVYAQKSS
jgi:hypothetical protein